MKRISYFAIILFAFLGFVIQDAIATAPRLNDNLNLLISTPFGKRPKKCVHTHVSGTTIRETADGVEAIDPNGFKQFFPIDKECLEYDKKWKAKVARLRSKQVRNQGMNLSTLEWLDNAWWYPPVPVKMLSGTYTVPNNPKQPGDYILYYFLGTENLQPDVELTILQPVLKWTSSKWSFTSWNCCPAGQAHSAKPVPVVAKSNIYGKVQQQSNDWIIDSVSGSQHSTLKVANMNRVFNYVDATLEIYRVYGCSYYPTDPIYYKNISIQLNNGTTATPSWQKTGPTECKGKVTITSSKEINIKHN